MTELVIAKTIEEYAAASALFREYVAWLNIDLSFQHFDEELHQLHEMYGPPEGAILLCKSENEFIGCVAVRKIDAITAELKRMYVLQTQRHSGIGSQLLYASLDIARKYGYRKMRLDTLSNMTEAIKLYKKAGFYEIPAYYFNPEATAVYFEKKL